jgi:hypothetical protein
MSRSELKEFRLKQKQAQHDFMWDIFMEEKFMDDDIFD